MSVSNSSLCQPDFLLATAGRSQLQQYSQLTWPNKTSQMFMLHITPGISSIPVSEPHSGLFSISFLCEIHCQYQYYKYQSRVFFFIQYQYYKYQSRVFFLFSISITSISHECFFIQHQYYKYQSAVFFASISVLQVSISSVFCFRFSIASISQQCLCCGPFSSSAIFFSSSSSAIFFSSSSPSSFLSSVPSSSSILLSFYLPLLCHFAGLWYHDFAEELDYVPSRM